MVLVAATAVVVILLPFLSMLHSIRPCLKIDLLVHNSIPSVALNLSWYIKSLRATQGKQTLGSLFYC